MSFGVEHLTFSYGDKVIFNDYTLTLPDRGVVVMTAPSGWGKTTLLRLLAGLERPQGGTVAAPKRPAVIFQEDRLLPWMSLLDNVAIVSDRARAEKYLAAVGLSDDKDALPAQCSGGMCRRAAVARALAYGGDALLADEPFNGLDLDNALRVVALIREQARRKPVVLMTHNAELGDLCAQPLPAEAESS